MRKIILNCTVAALAACSFAAPVLADNVYVRERSYDDGYRHERVRPGITISERGVTFGAVRDLWNSEKISFGVGGDLTFYSKPDVLDTIYGDNPVSWKLFFRVRPGKMKMNGAHDKH